jgi:hypothetical protein
VIPTGEPFSKAFQKDFYWLLAEQARSRPHMPPSQSCRNLRFSASSLASGKGKWETDSRFQWETSFRFHRASTSTSPVAKSRVVGEPIAESRVVGEPIVIQNRPLAIFGKILEDSCYIPTKCTVTLFPSKCTGTFWAGLDRWEKRTATFSPQNVRVHFGPYQANPAGIAVFQLLVVAKLAQVPFFSFWS